MKTVKPEMNWRPNIAIKLAAVALLCAALSSSANAGKPLPDGASHQRVEPERVHGDHSQRTDMAIRSKPRGFSP